ncbi:metalloprotease PmbA [Legionella impletisoli]|uniref:Peptidase C69 n=1 Tax=Legionella impletisoli TaxID=343510 RepID=A0A917JR33_9GAMM|nr:metalloprotease PmbA [Legionella impletisoli]GGI79523.1 peptidase C69 [Legionella impletisoli]
MEILTKNNKSTLPKSTHELKQLMHQVLQKAKDLGATDASVSINHDSGYSVDVRMGEVETVEFSEDKGVGVTVYLNRRKGSASSTDTSLQAIEAMVAAAYDIAKVSAEDPCFGLADKALVNNDLPDLDLYHPWPLTPSDAIEKVLACEHTALGHDKRITNSDGVNLSTYVFHHGYANTNGCEAVVSSSRHSVSCSLIAKKENSMQRDYDYTTARDNEDLLDLNRLANRAAERTVSRLGARKIKTRKAPVVFSSRLSHGLFSTFIAAISGSNLYRKNSFLLNALGQQIFQKHIRIYEQPHLLKGLGSSPIDGEGVPTRNNVMVDQGVLQQYVLGSYSARKLGLKTTANSDGVFNLTIDPTTQGLEAILNKMNRGLLVTELMGQGINILTGDYSRGASGFWVEHGEIQFPVEEITIAGNLKTMFQSIEEVGNDINPNVATRCGSVLVSEMMIAGD